MKSKYDCHWFEKQNERSPELPEPSPFDFPLPRGEGPVPGAYVWALPRPRLEGVGEGDRRVRVSFALLEASNKAYEPEIVPVTGNHHIQDIGVAAEAGGDVLNEYCERVFNGRFTRDSNSRSEERWRNQPSRGCSNGMDGNRPQHEHSGIIGNLLSRKIRSYLRFLQKSFTKHDKSSLSLYPFSPMGAREFVAPQYNPAPFGGRMSEGQEGGFAGVSYQNRI